MLLLSIDPAAERSVSSTGWALGEFSDTEPYTLRDSGVIEGGFAGFSANKGRLCWFAEIVVVEHYVVYNRNGDPTPLLIEGVVRDKRPDTVLQGSSGKNTLVSDKNLKDAGLWSTTGHHHDEREAVRHALVYLIKARHIPTITFVKGGPT
jgi:hypothetical protein